MVQRTKNQNAIEIGMWNAICDRCGFKFKNIDLKVEWNGLMTCKDCWEPRHPLDFVRGIPDDSSVPWSRPDSNSDSSYTDVGGTARITDNTVDDVGDVDKTLTVASVHSIQDWNTELTADRTATLDATGAVDGDRFTIYRTGGGAFDLIIGSLKTADIPSLTIVEFRNGAWTLVSYTPLGT